MQPTMDQIVETHLQHRGAPVSESNKRITVLHWMMLLSESPADAPEELKGRELEFIQWASKYAPK